MHEISNKFNTASDKLETEFRKRTVGLVSAEDFRKARLIIDNTKQIETEQYEKQMKLINDTKIKNRELKRKQIASSLSFQEDNQDDDTINNNDIVVIKKLKNPNVDTSFLPDKTRDLLVKEQKDKLQQEWLEQQNIVKNEVYISVYIIIFRIYTILYIFIYIISFK